VALAATNSEAAADSTIPEPFIGPTVSDVSGKPEQPEERIATAAIQQRQAAGCRFTAHFS
jgi:hypothetical protein